MQELSQVQEQLVHPVVQSVLRVFMHHLREYHFQLHAFHVLLVAFLMLVQHLVLRARLAYPQQALPLKAHLSLRVQSVLLATQALSQIRVH